ncbi:RusA family crossover junction endodeoxyribonuclease [Methylobacterium bullatum]|uniref:Uncharacterized protein n=1 Tax=Methylobacterium bullatum TaxID=570505 RepID=A0AAV4ZCU4_9HYPH|nr:RusA family crossover junction endodeoxyribonuclease [Methylobacterium bullatum]MBD8902755.1 hypothetical protein [Methylobacterium bullatum]GJD41339.1 hypothetical protein OICFNHDK_3822 [Methylobacterium bullatum]
MICFTVAIPPSTNNLFFSVPGRGRVKSDAYKAWIKEASIVAKLAIRAKRIDGPYALCIQIGKPDNRKRDIGNLEKPISDLLVSIGAVNDDGDCQRIEMEWSPNVDGAFVRVMETKAVPTRKTALASAEVSA